ncbi:hypothetical protein ABE288_26460 [Bacillus salipaludis]|uniref:hypothetical protein n=1 Tax=Bacillus salipaludis TaxID=2547811 RepID=UPI003D1B8099
MQDWWIYQHFINTLWFILFLISLPAALGLFMIYSYLKNNKQNGSQESNQNNQDQQQDTNQNQSKQSNQENQNDQQTDNQESQDNQQADNQGNQTSGPKQEQPT